MKNSIKLLALGLICLLLQSCQREPGVQLYNKIDNESHAHIKKINFLEADEKAIAYYDNSIFMDGSEVFILTNKRVGHFTKTRQNTVLLTNIKNIAHENKALTGDIITIQSDTGEKLIITIEPLNNGDLFLKELKEQHNLKDKK